MEDVAKGNLRARQLNTKDEVGMVADSLNRTLDEVGQAIRGVADATNDLARMSREMAATSEEVSASVEQIASTTNEFSSTIEQVHNRAMGVRGGLSKSLARLFREKERSVRSSPNLVQCGRIPTPCPTTSTSSIAFLQRLAPS